MKEAAVGSAIRSMSYVYDAAGNMTTKDETVRGVSKQYQYAYDAFGNRIRSEQTGSAAASYDYNAANQLLKKTQGGETSLYEYDKRGNLITEKVNGQTAAKYTYNEANRLAKLEKDGIVKSYQYNVNGHRVKKTESGRATAYVLDPLSPYGETLETYVDGKRADSIVYGNERISVRNSQDKTYNYSLDHLGSVNELRSADGSVAQSYFYDEFGEMLMKPRDNSVVSAHFSYTGHEYNIESGLYYAKARYLDASLGRFVSEDTYEGELNNPLSQNLYTYVLNNPLRYTDPSGNFPVLVALIGKQVLNYGLDVMIGVGTDYLDHLNTKSGTFNVKASIKKNAKESIVPGLGFLKKIKKAYKLADRINDAQKKAKKAKKTKGKTEKHHIATDKSKKYDFKNHPAFKETGINVSKDIDNLVDLANHRGRHTNKYHQEVQDRLDAVYKRYGGTNKLENAVRTELQKMKQELLDGKLDPYKK